MCCYVFTIELGLELRSAHQLWFYSGNSVTWKLITAPAGKKHDMGRGLTMVG